MVINFAGALRQALLRVFERRTLQLRWWHAPYMLLRDNKHHRGPPDSRGSTVFVLFPPARQFFSSLIDGCLKYKNKDKPKQARGPGRNAGL